MGVHWMTGRQHGTLPCATPAQHCESAPRDTRVPSQRETHRVHRQGSEVQPPLTGMSERVWGKKYQCVDHFKVL